MTTSATNHVSHFLMGTRSRVGGQEMRTSIFAEPSSCASVVGGRVVSGSGAAITDISLWRCLNIARALRTYYCIRARAHAGRRVADVRGIIIFDIDRNKRKAADPIERGQRSFHPPESESESAAYLVGRRVASPLREQIVHISHARSSNRLQSRVCVRL